METLNQFYDRIWVSFLKDKVWVFKKKRGEGRPDKMDIKSAKNYIQYLENLYKL